MIEVITHDGRMPCDGGIRLGYRVTREDGSEVFFPPELGVQVRQSRAAAEAAAKAKKAAEEAEMKTVRVFAGWATCPYCWRDDRVHQAGVHRCYWCQRGYKVISQIRY